ncbi:hypothetical protein ACFYNZ_04800 [Streptomyces kebangsaanensis]|uniref:Uncharacterized protein n=1 Tax=Streptomyces kebangsaanensis TaxID=864058 RepID=A0ABW6KQW1_9ACTN
MLRYVLVGGIREHFCCSAAVIQSKALACTCARASKRLVGQKGDTVLDAAQLAQEITPYIVTAVSAYGTAVFTRAEDAAADATVSFGQRLLSRLTGRGTAPSDLSNEQEAVLSAANDLAMDLGDADLVAFLRLQIRRLLNADPELAAEIAAMPRPAQADGDHIEFHGTIHGPVLGKGSQTNHFGAREQ